MDSRNNFGETHILCVKTWVSDRGASIAGARLTVP